MPCGEAGVVTIRSEHPVSPERIYQHWSLWGQNVTNAELELTAAIRMGEEPAEGLTECRASPGR